MTPLAFVVSLPVRAYRLLLSPWLGNGCRFQPTCSAYAMEALERHGAIRGSALAARRICRCHPWGGHGYDPVPGADPAHDAARAALPAAARTGGAPVDTPPPSA